MIFVMKIIQSIFGIEFLLDELEAQNHHSREALALTMILLIS